MYEARIIFPTPVEFDDDSLVSLELTSPIRVFNKDTGISTYTFDAKGSVPYSNGVTDILEVSGATIEIGRKDGGTGEFDIVGAFFHWYGYVTENMPGDLDDQSKKVFGKLKRMYDDGKNYPREILLNEI